MSMSIYECACTHVYEVNAVNSMNCTYTVLSYHVPNLSSITPYTHQYIHNIAHIKVSGGRFSRYGPSSYTC